MAKPYRVGVFVRFNNSVMRLLIRTGAKIGTFAILTVPGRRSGRLIDTPLVVFTDGHDRYLVAPYGIVNWVRNIRAAHGEATLTRGRRSEAISAIELPPAEAAQILRKSLQAGPPGIPQPIVRAYRRYFVLPYLDVDMTSAPGQFERSALSHPVFRLSSQEDDL